MATETSPVAIYSSARQVPGVTGATTVADGAIAFHDRLTTEINTAAEQTEKRSLVAAGRAQLVADGSSQLPSNPTTGGVVNGSTPLYERLYGTRPLSVTGIIGTPPAATDSTAMLRIRRFANAIRTPASIAAHELGTSTNTVIAFAGLETGWGQHIPAAGNSNSNNLFGIKAHHNSHNSVTNATTEYINGEAQTFNQPFRSYQSVEDSIADFSRFLRGNPRYDGALKHADNPKQFIKMVHEAGYATDPNYASKVIGALEQLDNITTKTGAIGIGWR